MSRRPGIGRRFYDSFKSDLYNHDKCVVNNSFVLRPPRYYDTLFAAEDPAKMATLKVKRKAAAETITDLPERLETRDKIAKIKQAKIKRKFEENT